MFNYIYIFTYRDHRVQQMSCGLSLQLEGGRKHVQCWWEWTWVKDHIYIYIDFIW